MTEQTSNDNHAAHGRVRWPEPDAHGQAAMLLVESLVHGLIARGVMTARDAVEIVDVAAEVKDDIGEELGDTPATKNRSLALLGAIRLSLTNDLAD